MHRRVDGKARTRGESDREDQKGEDEERSLLPRFLAGLGDPEGIDKGIGEKVEESHNSHYAPLATHASNVDRVNPIDIELAGFKVREID